MLRRTKCPLFGLWHPVPFLNCSSILCAPVPNTIQTKGAPPTSSSSSFSSPPSCLCLPHICYSPPSPMTPQLLLQLEGVLPSPMTSPEACVRRCKGNVGPLTLLYPKADISVRSYTDQRLPTAGQDRVGPNVCFVCLAQSW